MWKWVPENEDWRFKNKNLGFTKIQKCKIAHRTFRPIIPVCSSTVSMLVAICMTQHLYGKLPNQNIMKKEPPGAEI